VAVGGDTTPGTGAIHEVDQFGIAQTDIINI